MINCHRVFPALAMGRLALVMSALVGSFASQAPAADSAAVTFAPMSTPEIVSRLTAWAKHRNLSDPQIEQITAQWQTQNSQQPAEERLEQAVKTMARFEPSAEKLLASAEQRDWPACQTALSEWPAEAFSQGNLRLYVARLMVEDQHCDEALEELQRVDPAEVIDPASLFFLRAVCGHLLLENAVTLEAIDHLLTRTTGAPERYTTTARLMQEDLKQFSEDSLDQVSRLMSDSERRLELGRAGQKVQGVQERIVASLDELIKKIEQQQGGGGGGGSGSNGGNQSNGPLDDSRVKGQTAPGEVDEKKFANKGRWGDLPPKEEAAAKNLINRNFPSHYRQAIETYFRKLANRTVKSDNQP